MKRMHAKHKGDDEIAIAVRAVAARHSAGPARATLRNAMQAAAIAEDIFQRNPKHPGAAHFIIHSFDDPDHAILALPAARAYAKIAPSAAHALHMPSHIFVQLGLWDDVVASNIVAYKAAVDLAEREEPAARPRGLPHAVVAAVRLPPGRQVRRRRADAGDGEGGRGQGQDAGRQQRLRAR